MRYMLVNNDDETLNKLKTKIALSKKYRRLASLTKSQPKSSKFSSAANRYERQAEVLLRQLDPEIVERSGCHTPLFCDNIKGG